MNASPTTIAANCRGEIIDFPELRAAGRSGKSIVPLDPAQLIPLPDDSPLYLLPGRSALGFDANDSLTTLDKDWTAVAAIPPPGYLALLLTPFQQAQAAPCLPLLCYGAVCWYRDRFHVAATRLDRDPRHDAGQYQLCQVMRAVRRELRRHPDNRLLAHHGLQCVQKYQCPNAINLFMRRWEAPIAVAQACNAACIGCISHKTKNTPQAPQARINFTPTLREILAIAIPHLEQAPDAIISFGQGCEGEPLLKGKLLEDAIRSIRRQTSRGLIHLNTNGSLPDVVAHLADAGLDSIRVSINSVRPRLYTAYYRCHYKFTDVIKSLRVARARGLWVALNYLTFPGVADDPREARALRNLLSRTEPDMIQWRNLNIDPDVYTQVVNSITGIHSKPLGIKQLLAELRREFPLIRFGCFNPVNISRQP